MLGRDHYLDIRGIGDMHNYSGSKIDIHLDIGQILVRAGAAESMETTHGHRLDIQSEVARSLHVLRDRRQRTLVGLSP